MRSNQMLAFGFENILFLLLIAVALLFQLLSRVASASKDSEEEAEPDEPRTHPPIPRPRPKPMSDQERIREFLEALGQPTSAKPPPPVVHRTDIPPRPVAPIQPPPSMRPFSFPQPRLTREERRKSVVILHEAAQASAPAFEVHERRAVLESPPPLPVVRTAEDAYAIAGQPTTAPQPKEATIAMLLRSTSGLRQAIILREIFGPPRSMQPLDLVGSI